jgi:hypothetical protein
MAGPPPVIRSKPPGQSRARTPHRHNHPDDFETRNGFLPLGKMLGRRPLPLQLAHHVQSRIDITGIEDQG